MTHNEGLKGLSSEMARDKLPAARCERVGGEGVASTPKTGPILHPLFVLSDTQHNTVQEQDRVMVPAGWKGGGGYVGVPRGDGGSVQMTPSCTLEHVHTTSNTIYI